MFHINSFELIIRKFSQIWNYPKERDKIRKTYLK